MGFRCHPTPPWSKKSLEYLVSERTPTRRTTPRLTKKVEGKGAAEHPSARATAAAAAEAVKRPGKAPAARRRDTALPDRNTNETTTTTDVLAREGLEGGSTPATSGVKHQRGRANHQ